MAHNSRQVTLSCRKLTLLGGLLAALMRLALNEIVPSWPTGHSANATPVVEYYGDGQWPDNMPVQPSHLSLRPVQTLTTPATRNGAEGPHQPDTSTEYAHNRIYRNAYHKGHVYRLYRQASCTDTHEKPTDRTDDTLGTCVSFQHDSLNRSAAQW